MPVGKVTIDNVNVTDLVDSAIKEASGENAPEIKEEEKVASKSTYSENILQLADELDKVANSYEDKENSDLSEFKKDESEKEASLKDIAKNYVELNLEEH